MTPTERAAWLARKRELIDALHARHTNMDTLNRISADITAIIKQLEAPEEHQP